MGFGDPCHKHPLKFAYTPDGTQWYDKKNRGIVAITCFHCELPIEDSGYTCSRCDFWVHYSCIDLPRIVTHPLHPQHPLILSCDTNNTGEQLCNKCQTPCIGGRYAYYCRACEFSLHPNCFFTHQNEKHGHILSFSTTGKCNYDYFDCRICGYPVYDFNFGCTDCGFFIHHDCSLIPLTIKHHHTHDLTILHDFPEECDQAYCDICEDKDGKELDHTLSYYYCKTCDYITHVRCVIQQKKDVFLVERYTHEHPLRLVRDPVERENYGFNLGCDECNEIFDDRTLLFPSLIKHPLHPEHALTWLFNVDDGLFKCTICEFTLCCNDATKFTHPLIGEHVEFCSDRIFFGCDACGELGKGSRMSDGDLDFHLECYALPGKIDHESHVDHPLYLYVHDISTYRNCSVCNEEIDSGLWTYCCKECDYIAHMNCVASGYLSNLRSSIQNEPRFCNIVEPDKTSFAKMKLPEDLYIPSPRHQSSSGYLIFVQDTNDSENDVLEDDKADCGKDLDIEEAGNVLCCPKCHKQVFTPAKYSAIQDWETSHFSELKTDLSESEPLNLLTEQEIDDLYCPICSVLIFPPTYSCSSCQIYFHKSCADLPRKVTLLGLTYALVKPPFPDNLSSCSHCSYPISGYAYLSSDNGSIFDVQCLVVAPLIKQVIHRHRIFCRRNTQKDTKCEACDTCVEDGAPFFVCAYLRCSFKIHTECALLPNIIRHEIHKHPLELVYDLAELDDEYICDACENKLNPNLSAYRCVDTCKGYATSHVTCVITSKKKCRFKYDLECQDMSEDQKIAFRTTTELGARKYGLEWYG